MRKILLSLLLTGIVAFSCASATKAADITFTKPTIKVNTSQEQNAIQKAKADAEKAKAEKEKKQQMMLNKMQNKLLIVLKIF